MKINRAMILSAGFGKRLAPLTLSIPKPILKIGSKNLLKNTINILEKFGISEIVINVHYLSKQIISFIENNKFNSKIFIMNESKEILDTGGGILNAISHFKSDPFFVLNPDTIWSESYLNEFNIMENFFFDKTCKCLLLLVNRDKSFDKSMSGDFNLSGNKVSRNSKDKQFVFTGAQILTQEAFTYFTPGQFSLNKVWDLLISKNLLIGQESRQEFLHVSNLKIYKELSKIVKY